MVTVIIKVGYFSSMEVPSQLQQIKKVLNNTHLHSTPIQAVKFCFVLFKKQKKRFVLFY